MSDGIFERVCRRCDRVRTYPDDYHKNGRYKDGRSPICKYCVCAIERERPRAPRAPRARAARRSRAVDSIAMESAAMAREELRIAAANQRAMAKLIPIDWPVTRKAVSNG